MPKKITEEDVPTDKNVASSRATGGVPDPDALDQASTTGSSPTPEYVGRIAGDDIGFIGETGAERRAAVYEAEKGNES